MSGRDTMVKLHFRLHIVVTVTVFILRCQNEEVLLAIDHAPDSSLPLFHLLKVDAPGEDAANLNFLLCLLDTRNYIVDSSGLCGVICPSHAFFELGRFNLVDHLLIVELLLQIIVYIRVEI